MPVVTTGKYPDGTPADEMDAAYAHVAMEADKGSQDTNRGGAPLWHGWALRAAFLAGIVWQKAKTPVPAFKLNSDHTVAVATDVFWNEDMKTCPRGCKVQLLGRGGVASYGVYTGDPFWIKWAPLPRNKPA